MFNNPCPHLSILFSETAYPRALRRKFSVKPYQKRADPGGENVPAAGAVYPHVYPQQNHTAQEAMITVT
jgi:hypothetical protein